MATFDSVRATVGEAASPSWRLAISLWLVLLAAAVLALWHLHRQALDGQERELTLLSTALTDDIDRGLRGAEEGLHAMRDELQDGRLPQSGPEARLALQTRADLMPLIDQLWLIDSGGHSLSTSARTAVPDLPGFAPPLADLGADAMAVSRPFIDPSSRRPGIALAIRYRQPGGTASGWIVAAMPASTLLGAFSAVAPDADVRMYVFRRDGMLLASADALAPRPDETSVARGAAGRPALEVRRFGDGSENLVGQRAVPRYGLQVVVSRNLAAMLADWRSATEATVAALLLILFVMVFSLHRVRLADRRRREAQRALQDQLGRAGKLESLGTLAGGVAHDFNNVLAGIVGYAELAQDAAAPGSAQAKHLDRVLQAALRGKTLIERILTFSRGGAKSSTPFEIEPVIEEVLSLLSATLRPGIVLERALEAAGARVRGDPAQAFEAVMNLCTNALQAMPRGGVLSVRTGRRRIEADRVLSHSQLFTGDYVWLSVADQGDGIATEVMDRLFQPFFTTRAAQAGTGLGLAVVHGVVAEFGGAIDVRSEVGHGARFTVYLPETIAGVGPIAAMVPTLPAGRGQRVLVVDDEPELVGLTLEMLEGLGYAAEGCIDAAAAMQVLRSGQEFSAVVTDEVMPGLSGTQLAQTLRQRGTAVPILLVSGFGGALLAERAIAAGVTRVLAKPLQRADLARALSEALR